MTLAWGRKKRRSVRDRALQLRGANQGLQEVGSDEEGPDGTRVDHTSSATASSDLAYNADLLLALSDKPVDALATMAALEERAHSMLAQRFARPDI